MQNDFEKQIQQQLHEYSLKPDDAVWRKVEAEIRRDKKRKRIFFFWISGAVILLAGLGSYYFISSNDHNGTVPKTTQISFKKSPNDEEVRGGLKQFDESKVAKDDHEVDKKERVVDDRIIKHGKQSKLQMISTNTINKGRTASNKSLSFPEKNYVNPNNNNKRLASTKVDDTKSNSITANTALDKSNVVASGIDIATANTITPKINNELKDSIAGNIVSKVDASKEMVTKQEDLPKVITEKQNEVKKDDIKINNESKIVNNKKQKLLFEKIKFGLTLSGGLSNNVTSFPVFSEEKALRDAFTGAAASSAPAQSLPVINDKFKHRSSFVIGGFAQVPLSAKFSLSTGLNYHYYSFALGIGSKVDSSRTFIETALNKTTNLSSYYRPGQSLEYKIKFHLVELPLNLQWQLNSNTNKPFNVYAGITPSLILASDGLLHNQQQRFYYKENDQYKRFQIFTQMGAMFTAAGATQTPFQVGPTFQYGVSNLTKPAIKTNEHLIFIGLKANLLFNKKVHLNK